MSIRAVGRAVVHLPARVRSRRYAALVVAFALSVTGLASASWAATLAPIPVKDKPTVTEVAPTADGAWFGWAQHLQFKPDHYNFYVQRGTRARVKVNSAGTQGLGGGIVGHSVFYVQQFRDRDPRINRFDLKTRQRTPLPSKVNHRRDGRRLHGVRGEVTVSGDWLMYSGFTRPGTFANPRHTVMLYNRATHELRQLAAVSTRWGDYHSGQVNGNYASFVRWDFTDPLTSSVTRYNIKTKRFVELRPSVDSLVQSGPSVSSDGTVYYFQTDVHCVAPCLLELVRQPIAGPAEVIATAARHGRTLGERQTFVRDRPDGSRVVFFTWKRDIYKVVDDPQPAVSRQR
jgi:hypothetical protein